jgi:hypothetical protein
MSPRVRKRETHKKGFSMMIPRKLTALVGCGGFFSIIMPANGITTHNKNEEIRTL